MGWGWRFQADSWVGGGGPRQIGALRSEARKIGGLMVEIVGRWVGWGWRS